MGMSKTTTGHSKINDANVLQDHNEATWRWSEHTRQWLSDLQNSKLRLRLQLRGSVKASASLRLRDLGLRTHVCLHAIFFSCLIIFGMTHTYHSFELNILLGAIHNHLRFCSWRKQSYILSPPFMTKGYLNTTQNLFFQDVFFHFYHGFFAPWKKWHTMLSDGP